MLKNVSAFLLTMTVIACASAGRRIDRTHLGDIANGAQNKDQIRAWFGQPYTTKAGLPDHPRRCVERWTYEFAKARGRGTVTYSEILVVDFDASGSVCDHAFSQTGAN